MEKLVIIDGNAIVHRAYHALPPMRVKDGSMVNVVYGFASMLLKIINDIKPEYLAVSFDVAGGTFRDKVFADYKATRVKADQDLYDQFPLVYDLVNAFNIPIFTKEGFEADDVIGTLAFDVAGIRNTPPKADAPRVQKGTKLRNVKSLIVTGDKDLLQLVDDKNNIEVMLLKKGMSEFESCNEQGVIDKFGFGPDMIVSYKSLCGDSSDNIPGVKGIGDKTATSLIIQIGSIDKIYEELENKSSDIYEEFSSSVTNKLNEQKASAFMSKELATIRTDVEGIDFDLEKAKTQDFDREKIVSLFQKFEFYSLIKRLPGSENILIQKNKKIKNKLQLSKKIIRVDEKNIEDVTKNILQENYFVAKEIMLNENIFAPNNFSLLISTLQENYFFENINEKVFRIFENEKIFFVGHDLKNLIKLIQLQKIEIKNKIFDTMIASYILNSSTRAHDIKSVCLRELGKEILILDAQKSLFGIDPQNTLEEVQATLEVYNIYREKLKAEKNEDLYFDIEMPLLKVLAEMELNGIAIDVDLLNDLSQQVNKTLGKLEKQIWEEAGEEFNVASSVQLRDILFDKMDLPTQGIKKGKTGYSTAASELEKLRDFHPIISYIEEFRELEKLRNTYIDVLPNLRNQFTNRIHTTYNQTVASTGRLSSSDPNLQNIPIRTELGKKVREVFIAEKGNALIAADYSQIELRVVASLAKDERMIEIFKNKQDIHTATAAAINGVDIKDVSKEMRRAAKEVNFGVLYGMGAFGLASRTGISRYDAQSFIDKYFASFAGVKNYMENILKQAEEDGFVETLFGRRRYIPELHSNNFQLRSSGERMAVNMPVQGTAADIMKLAMIAVSNKINIHKYENKVRLCLQVHDELVLEVSEDLKDEIAELVKQEMQNVVKLEVPLDVEVNIGYSWGRLK